MNIISRTIILILLCILTLSGCYFRIPFFTKEPELDHAQGYYPEDDNTLVTIENIDIPEPGDTLDFYDEKSGQHIYAQFGKSFSSASGTLCIPISYSTEKMPEKKQSLACLNEKNFWSKSSIDIQLIQKTDSK